MKIPTLQQVNAAWLAARVGADAGVTDPHAIRTIPHEARSFYQGVVLQHLRMKRDRRKLPGLFRPLTKAERRAIRLTRQWLEFGEWL